jgi:hypothetical protein
MSKWMLALALSPALLVACGGGDEDTEECDDPAPMDVEVTVTAPDGATPVADAASVTLDGEDCENAGDGKYLCVAMADGSWQLAIVDTRYTAYSQFLQLPEFECEENAVFKAPVQLAGMMGS